MYANVGRPIGMANELMDLESESTGFEGCKLNKQEKSTRMRKGNTFHLYWFN